MKVRMSLNHLNKGIKLTMQSKHFIPQGFINLCVEKMNVKPSQIKSNEPKKK
jgi:hypothetical protein